MLLKKMNCFKYGFLLACISFSPVVALADNTIAIESCEQLAGIGNSTGALSANYAQVSDLDCSNIADFKAIGTRNSPFTGTYDGGDFEIRNLSIQADNYDNAALFGYLREATISNVRLVNVEIEATEGRVGALAAHSERSYLSKSSATGKVAGSFTVGGLIGYASETELEQCYADVDATGEFYVGGLIGVAMHGSVEDSYATGAVTGEDGVGGLIGEIVNMEIKNTYATGLVTGGRDLAVGGLVGRGLPGTDIVIASYWDINTSAQLASPEAIGEGRTTRQMQLMRDSDSIYVDWDSSIWLFQKGQYPSLQALM